KLIPPPIPLPPSYLVFVPIASYSSKLWPEEYWEALIEKAKILGHFILIPWGNEKERQRALRLSNHSHVTILPKLSLSEISYLILHSKAVVSMDTGFSHIAAALNIPAITLYGPTDPALTGTVGENQVHLCSPCPCLGKKTCAQAQKPMCLCKITPSYVFFELQKLLNTL
ncbi:MAG: lipopolysaccharide heptosyltransferase 1, partial [Verrucomicrobia bacterium]|nr:lipopolysaccharide heptosyltransferase 1 [Verrucomicrobiota bacterium]